MPHCTRGKLPRSPLSRVLCALHPHGDTPVEAQGTAATGSRSLPWRGGIEATVPALERAGRWIWLFSSPTMGETEARAKGQAQGCRGRRWQRRQLGAGPVAAVGR